MVQAHLTAMNRQYAKIPAGERNLFFWIADKFNSVVARGPRRGRHFTAGSARFVPQDDTIEALLR
jgi:hypothetical protein